MKKITTLLLALIFVFTLTSCQQNNPSAEVVETPEEQEIITIVTTILPLYSLTKYITYNTPVVVDNIVPPGASEHNFQLTPKLAQKIENADFIVMNGLDLEEFLEDSVAETKAIVIDTSAGIELIKNEEEEAHTNEVNTNIQEEEHPHGEYDPHIWLSPINAIKQSENILKVLVEKNPKYKKEYENNFKWLKYNLEKLDKEIINTIKTAKIGNYLTFHTAFSYFDKQYGTKPSGVIQEFPGKEPSIEYMKSLADLIKNNNIKVVFKEPQSSPKLAETLAKDYNLTVSELDPVGKEVSKESYFKMMRKNLKNFTKAFLEIKKSDEKTT